MNFKKIGLGLAATAAMTTGMVLAEKPAQALNLNLGNKFLGLDGSVTIFREGADLYDFSFSNIIIDSNSDSPPFKLGDAVTIASLSNISEAGSPFGPIAGFITDIELTDGEIVSFDLTNLSLDVTQNRNTNYALTFEGNFLRASGDVFGFGSITSQFAGNLTVGSTVTRNLSGDITAVPTPALLPGLVGMGLAALRKRKEEGAEQPEEVKA